MEGLSAEAPLARCLARGRERFNARVALARRQGVRLEPAALAAHLCAGVAPAVEAVARAAPGREGAVTDALFELSLELLPRAVVGPGARHLLVGRVWRELLPRVARHLAAAPRLVAASLTNAALHLEQEPRVRGGAWVEGLGTLAPACADAAQLLSCGQVLAWRAGLAHLRESALEVWRALPDALAVAAVAPGSTLARELLARGLAEPFWHPERAAAPAALQLVAEVGDFAGLGGPFLAPPRVFVSGGQVHVADGDAAWALHADAFGQTLRRVATPGREEHPAGLGRVHPDGRVAFRGLEARLPVLEGANGFAATPALLAVTHTLSHRVALVARTGGLP